MTSLFAAFLIGIVGWYEHPKLDFDSKVPVMTLDKTYTTDEGD